MVLACLAPTAMEGIGVFGQSENGTGLFGSGGKSTRRVWRKCRRGTGISESPVTGWGEFIGNVSVSGTLTKAAAVQDRSSARPREQVSLALVRRVARHDEHLQRQRHHRCPWRGDGRASGLLRGAQPDFRYQFTVIGHSRRRSSHSEIRESLHIKTDKPQVKVSWQVTGIRQDA